MLGVEKALESGNLNELKAANAALDQGTVALADLVMDLALDEHLRKKGMLSEETTAAPVTKAEPMAPTGIEGSIPLKGE